MTLAEVSSIERYHCQACARYTFEISAFGTIYPLAHVEPFRLQTADSFLMSVPGRIHAHSRFPESIVLGSKIMSSPSQEKVSFVSGCVA